MTSAIRERMLSLRSIKGGPELIDLVAAASGRVVILSGAGLSTASGLPAYRSPGATPYRPLQHQQFVSSAEVRKRYWARSFTGWQRLMGGAKPNAGHVAIAGLQSAGVVSNIITQNVDRLHHAAGSPASTIVELHGTVHTAHCPSCGTVYPRGPLQDTMATANANWWTTWSPRPDVVSARPDGDVELPPDASLSFVPPTCKACTASPHLAPSVIFHGGNLVPSVAARAMEVARDAGALLVVGSTLQTLSGLRLVTAAKQVGARIAVINLGATRADPVADVLVAEHTSSVLTSLAEELRGVTTTRERRNTIE